MAPRMSTDQSAQDALDPFELGRLEGAESGSQQPLTEEQERKVRTLLRHATDAETPPAKAS